MKVSLAYGQGNIDIDIPSENVDIIKKKSIPVVTNPQQSIFGACTHPIGSAPLEYLIRSSKSACILLCDITRPVPNELFVRYLVEQCLVGGINAENITLLIATGLHRPNSGDELARLIGDPWVLEHANVVNHIAENDDDHKDLGRTSRNTPIRIDRRFLDAELRIVTGLVEPHFMAGYSGGRKVVAPGICHADTIRCLHNAAILDDPRTRSCNLHGNPLHDEQLQILAAIRRKVRGEIYAVNTLVDENRELLFMNFGEIYRSHLEAVESAHSYATISCNRRFDVVITSAGGYPLDLTYYQTIKGMVTPLDIVQPDGSLLVLSQCQEGLGSENYRNAQRRLIQLGKKTFLDELRAKPRADIDEWESQMQIRAQEQADVSLFSDGLNDSDRQLTVVSCINDPNAWLAEKIQSKPESQVAVIPEGPYVVPTFAG